MSAPTDPGRSTVAVCGGGLIGASLALGAAAAGHRVRVFERDAATRAALLTAIAERGAPARSVTVSTSWEEAARGADVVVAAVPPSAVAEVLVAAAAVAGPDALMTDVASSKLDIVASVGEALATAHGAAALERFVGGHPMAGSERSGPGAADATLFSGATWVLTPTAETADPMLARASDLLRDLGARALVLAPDEHDRLVGLVSHLPQLVASVLADVAADAVASEQEAVMAVAGPGFRDTTRIAASDPALWLDIIQNNRAAVLTALEAFTERFATVVDAVRTGDTAGLGTLLGRASEARRQLVSKAIDEATQDLLVPLRDRPGEIARITAALGSVGINIEDLAMRHATAADRGSLLLRVRETSAARAIDVLAAVDVTALVAGTGSGSRAPLDQA